MKEELRLDIIEKINKDLNVENDLTKASEELKALEQTPEIQAYFELKRKIEGLTRIKDQFQGKKEPTIDFEFRERLTKEKDTCSHEIWIFAGSFTMWKISETDEPREIRVLNERCKNFHYNKYICLECGKVIDTAEWVNFEAEHNVKMRCFRQPLNWKAINEEYYQLLYEYNDETAKKLLLPKSLLEH